MSRKGENIFKRKDGRWEARYIHHYENGVAKYRYIYGKTYTEVKRKRLIDQSTPNINKILKMQSVYSFEKLAFEWLNSIENTVKESTYSRYYRIIKKYLIPKLCQYDLNNIKPPDINSMITLFLTQNSYNGKPLASKTVSDILCVFKLIARYGNNKQITSLDLEQIRHPTCRKNRIKILDGNTINAMETELCQFEEPLYIGILLALYGGLRIGELCGLRWSDINFEKKTITIKRTIERIADVGNTDGRKTKVIISTPKTESSYREIPIQNFMMDFLKQNRTDDSYYILTGTEKYKEPHQYYVWYKKFLQKNNLGDYTFHSLRHTFATRCVESGFELKSLSEILGHKNFSTTMSIYVHPSMEQKRIQMEKIIPSRINSQNSCQNGRESAI